MLRRHLLKVAGAATFAPAVIRGQGFNGKGFQPGIAQEIQQGLGLVFAQIAATRQPNPAGLAMTLAYSRVWNHHMEDIGFHNHMEANWARLMPGPSTLSLLDQAVRIPNDLRPRFERWAASAQPYPQGWRHLVHASEEAIVKGATLLAQPHASSQHAVWHPDLVPHILRVQCDPTSALPCQDDLNSYYNFSSMVSATLYATNYVLGQIEQSPAVVETQALIGTVATIYAISAAVIYLTGAVMGMFTSSSSNDNN